MNKKYDINEILYVGRNLIRTQGYHNTGINDLLKASGIPKGSFYNFFESKEDFVLKALDQYGDANVEWMESFLKNKALSPKKRLQAFYEDTIRVNQHPDEACSHGCLINNMSVEVAGINQNLADATNYHYTRLLRLLAGCLQEGQESGEIRNDYSAEELAEYMHTNFFGALSRMKSTREITPLKRALKMNMDFISA